MKNDAIGLKLKGNVYYYVLKTCAKFHDLSPSQKIITGY